MAWDVSFVFTSIGTFLPKFHGKWYFYKAMERVTSDVCPMRRSFILMWASQ